MTALPMLDLRASEFAPDRHLAVVSQIRTHAARMEASARRALDAAVEARVEAWKRGDLEYAAARDFVGGGSTLFPLPSGTSGIYG